jgi:hypothetical protein
VLFIVAALGFYVLAVLVKPVPSRTDHHTAKRGYIHGGGRCRHETSNRAGVWPSLLGHVADSSGNRA